MVGLGRARLLVGALALAASLVWSATAPEASRAAACTPPVVNEIACENSKPGAPSSSWFINGSGDPSIQGFPTSMSVNRGQPISFKIKSTTASYTIDILRLGYYGGDGARRVASGLAPTGTSTQPACRSEASTGLIDCGNWAVSRSWTVPTDAVSGVYIAHLKRNDGTGSSHITFVVRDDASTSDVVLQTSDATWQAYNIYGGNSLYTCDTVCPPGNPRAYKAAFKVSYNRPLDLSTDLGSALFSGAEYSMIRFAEASGYDMTYIANVDAHRRGQLLANHKLFISSGHDEYWSASQRDNVETARDAGLNLAFFSGNEIFWKTRWEPSIDGTATADRTLVSYKDTHFDARTDPKEWTGTWRDPRFTTAADRVTPENALTGQSFIVNSGTSDITVPSAYRQLRLWRNTAVASLATGSTRLAPSTLGYEWDADADNGFRPPGQFRLSSTTVSGLDLFTDYGSTVQRGGTATHNLVMHRAPGGALVFGAGTVQWAWGLDDWNPTSSPPDRTMRQATVNLFADMGAQPRVLLPGLVAASASTDTTAPSSVLTAPPTTASDGAKLTLTGTATDAGGGVVAGVEVSTDGGGSWHPATTGTSSWTYTWIVHGSPSTRIMTRAVDDSGNLEVPGTGTSVAVTCPCSLWGSSETPAVVDAADPTPIEVGVKFRSEAYGSITGVRFYKATANTGTHVGSLWSADGQRLRTATFTNETASGWQTATFSSPVEVQPDTTYVASYHAPNGRFSLTSAYFFRSPAPGPNGGATVDSKPLHAIRNAGSTTNGVFAYSPTSTFPTASYDASNYWVDVQFTAIPAPSQVTGVTAEAGGRTSASVSWTAPAGAGKPTAYTVTPYVGTQAQAPKTITGSPPATTTAITGLTTGTTYTFTVKASNPNGDGPASAPSNAITPQQPVKPSAPGPATAEAASQAARVSWTAPEADGDSPITGYRVTPYVGATAQPALAAEVAASTTSTTLRGLTNATTYTFRVTATNAVGTSPPSTASGAVTPQGMIFDLATPAVADGGDPNPVELGVKFRAAFGGTVTGIRFYKAAANTGVHVGSLWTAGGQRLAQATFTNETASGWQTVAFATPVAVAAGTTYVASYFAPNGRYSATSRGLTTAVDNAHLQALGAGTSPNGVYAYGGASAFPAGSYNDTNYWVDVTYAMPVPGQVTGATAVEAGVSSARVTWTAPVTGGPATSYIVTPYVGTSAKPSTTVTGSPPATGVKVTGLTSGTPHTFTVQAANPNGTGPVSAASNAVTPSTSVAPMAPTAVSALPASASARVSWTAPAEDGDSPITKQTVTPYDGGEAQAPVEVGATATNATISQLRNGTSYTFRVTASNATGTSPASAASAAVTPRATIFDLATPPVTDGGDDKAAELGVKFRADFDGSVTGIRFYKGTANTGTHVGSLWTAGGQRLAQATFTGETATGWQSVSFASPVRISPDTTYVASYHAPRGRYAITGAAFATAVVNAPLRTLADAGGPNGVYAYTATSAFPTSSFNAANYWVDVQFQPDAAPGQVTNVTATAGLRSADVAWSAPTGGGRVTSYEVTPYVGTAAQAVSTVTGSPPGTSKTISGLTEGTEYTFRVRAVNPAGTGPSSSPSAPVTPLAPVAPSAPTGVSVEADASSVLVDWTAPSSDGGSPVTGYTVTPYAGSAAQSPKQVDAPATGTRISGLTSGTSYTFRVTATNASGTGMASGASAAVSPRASIFDFRTPAVADAGDPDPVALGVKFRADVDGSIVGVRFYKAAANTGAHVGSLWTAGGALLAQATFTGESASGWQKVVFAGPVPVTAGTIYVASYHAPRGRYSLTGAAFSTPFANPPLAALGDAAGANGVYAYSAVPVFPTSSFNASNYWVDVLFAAGP